MNQEAILFSRINAADIAAQLSDYTADELLEEYEYMLKTHYFLVLARDVLPGGFASVSYVVTREMFDTNNPGIQLTTEHFTHVRTV